MDSRLLREMVREGSEVGRGRITVLPEIDGRLDLRGLTVESNPLRSVAFTEVDFTWATLTGLWVERCAFDRVLFRETDMRTWRDHGNRYAACTFDRASLAGAGIGYHGSKYEQCVFRRVDFTGAVFARAEFDQCAFEDCRLDGVDFLASSFESCSFSGRLRDVWFRGGYPSADLEREFGTARPNRMHCVDFAHAELDCVTFSDSCDLGTCVLPPDDMVVRVNDLEGALNRIEERLIESPRDNEPQVRAAVALYRTFLPDQKTYILNFHDLRKLFGLSAEQATALRDLVTVGARS